VSANGIRLHVVEAGEGPLVVLLHGFPEFWWSWRHQLRALSEAGYRAVAVDLRGYGDSDKPPRGYDLWTLAGDVDGLIRALGEQRAHVVGHDWGGAIAWTVAALHPRRLHTLTTIGIAHPLAFRRALIGRQGRASRYMAGFQLPRRPEAALRQDDGARVERIMRAWSGPEWTDTADFAEAARRNREAIRISTVAHCALEYYRWMARSQVRAEGRRFAAAVSRPAEMPVLQIHGTGDPCVLESTAQASARWVRGSFTHASLPTGHFVHEELPEDTNRLVLGHLCAR
jgi:pimeloyl-ACP methyl ester carboxylesterase